MTGPAAIRCSSGSQPSLPEAFIPPSPDNGRITIAIRTEQGRRTDRAPDVPSTVGSNCAPINALSLANMLKKRDNTSPTSPRPSMSISQRSFAASAQRRPYDSTPFLSHARSVNACGRYTVAALRSVAAPD